MSNYINVNTETLRKDSNEITSKVNSLLSELQKVYTEVQQLDTMWEGPANAAFNAQFAADYENFRTVCTFINNFAKDMGSAAVEYERCEAEINSAIKALRV